MLWPLISMSPFPFEGRAASLEFRLLAAIAQFSLLAIIHVVPCISCSERKLDDQNSCSLDCLRAFFSESPPRSFLISLLFFDLPGKLSPFLHHAMYFCPSAQV